MFQNIIAGFKGKPKKENVRTIKGSVVLMKKNVLDCNDLTACLVDTIAEALGKRVSFELISVVEGDPGPGKVGAATYLEGWNRTLPPPDARESMFNVAFEWDEGMGIPGALIVKNLHCRQFFLKSLTLEDVPGKGQVHFDCNSWVYPAKYYKYNRVFFTNEASGYIDQMHMN